MKRVPAIFFRTSTGGEPVREWLRAMDAEDRRRIGEDLKTVEFGWPVGMPTCRAMDNGLYEVRTKPRRQSYRTTSVLSIADSEWSSCTDSLKSPAQRPRLVSLLPAPTNGPTKGA